MKDVNFRGGFVSCAEVDGAQSEKSLPEGTLHGDIKDSVQAYFFFGNAQDSSLYKKAVFVKLVFGECPRKAENYSFSVAPNVILLISHGVSPFSLFINNYNIICIFLQYPTCN